MGKKKSLYQVEFSIDNLSLREQQHIFEVVLAELNYNQRQELHVTVKDYIGGQHFIWDGTGKDPDGFECRDCNCINCEDCILYKHRKEIKSEK